MEEAARLRLIIDTGDAVVASTDLDQLSHAARQTETSFDKLKDEANKTDDAVDRVGDKAKKSKTELDELRKSASRLGTQLGVLAAGAASVAGVLLFKEARKAAEESAMVWAQVTQGIESTGSAARRTLIDIQKLASDIQDTTLFDDETVAFGAANLLTFTNIAEDAFDRTLRVATDVSQRVGQDFKSTIIQLGKALNDPIANLGALSRTGIQFSEVQKEQIANLVKQNKLFEAQSIILTEIEKQYGGSAAAVREAAGGAKAASNAFGDLLEELGGPVLEQTNDEFETLAKLLASDETKANARLIGQAIGEGMEFALEQLQNFIRGFNDFVDHLKRIGFLNETPIELKFDLVGPDVTGEQLREKILGEDETIRIGVEIDANQLQQVQDRLEQLDLRKQQLEKKLDLHTSGTVELNDPFKVSEELEVVNTEFKNLFAILTANAQAVGGVVKELNKVPPAVQAGTNAIKGFNSGLEQQVKDLEALAAAALQGPKAVANLQEEFAIRETLAKLEADAAKAGEAFDREKEERHLRELQRLQELIAANEDYLALVEKLTGTGAGGLADKIGKFNDRLSGDTAQQGLVSQNPFLRERTINDFDKQLDILRKSLLEMADQLDKETFDNLFASINEAGTKFEKDVKDSADYLKDKITEGARNLASSLIEDVLFNQGKGFGDILGSEARRDIKTSLIDPLSKFVSGEGSIEDLFGEIKGGFDDVVAKYEKIGGQLDKLFGTDGAFSEIFGAAGGGFTGFQLGSGAADIFNGSQGETGGKVGGAVGGAIGLAIPGVGPLVGSAVGSFVGDILGGLFGRKTGSAIIDIVTGEIDKVKNSKKDIRNERRDDVLQGAQSAIQQLADILGADLKNLALKVSAGKSSIGLDFVDPKTGRVVQSAGKVQEDDVRGAIDRVIQLAIDGLLTGGDDLLKKIARGFSAANVPAETLLDTLQDLKSVLELTEDPSSQFLDALEEVNDAFSKGKQLAGAYSGALNTLNSAQLDVLRALAGEFDESTDEQLRRLKNPVGQDALDLADEQKLRLRELTELNNQLAAAAKAVGGAEIAKEATAAQERLNDVIALNTAEWEDFIENAASTPEAFKAAADALDKLKLEAKDLPIAFNQISSFLENARLGLASAFDTSQQDRLLSLKDPLQAQFKSLLSEQFKLLESARQISKDPSDLQQRLALVAEGNTEELRQFIEKSANTADALEAAANALEKLSAELQASGADTTLLIRQVQLAQQALVDKTDEATVDRILRLVSSPTSELKALLSRQKDDVTLATRIGADVGLVQRANFLELNQFLDALSDADLAGIGDLFGLITDQVGRLPVALLELDDAFDKFVDNRQREIDRLNELGQDAGSAKERATDLSFSIRRQFGGLSALEEFEKIRGEFLAQASIAQDTTQTDEKRLDAVTKGEDLVNELLQATQKAFGGSATGASERDRLLAIVDSFAEISGGIEDRSFDLSEALDREYDVLVEIRDKISSADTDLTPFIQSALATGQISGSPQVIQDLLSEVVQLTLVQQQNRQDLTDALREAAVSGFANGVSITGTVSIDDDRLSGLMQQVIDTLNRIEGNQVSGTTLSRLGVAA